jgi:hypothetical protein
MAVHMSPCVEQNPAPHDAAPPQSGRNRSILALALLFVSLAAGGWLRLTGLDQKSVSHPEMYVPGIHLPQGASEPAERLSLAAVLTGTFSSDTHPPGYYIFMWPWTRVFGASLTAMRLPSALLGTGCIVLVFWLGTLIGRRGAGALAAALVAFHGYFVLWSKVARMFALASFLGLLATVLLLLICSPGPRRRISMALYAGVVLAGLSTHVFFWALFATHIAWCFVRAMRETALPDICRVQLLTLIAGSPLLAFAAYQSANTVASLSDRIGFFWGEFARFAFLLPNEQAGVFPVAPAGIMAEPGFWIIRAVLLLIALLLLWQGFRSVAKESARDVVEVAQSPLAAGQHAGLWSLAWILSGVAAAVAIVLFVFMTKSLPADRVNPTLRLTKILAVLPLCFAAVAVWLERSWPVYGRLARGTWKGVLAGKQGLVLMLAIMPAGLVSLVSLLRPFLNQRGMLFVGPYMLLLIAIGITALPRRASLRACLLIVLAAAYGLSLHAYAPMTVDPTDYATFAAALQSQIGAEDLIFVRKAWFATPILYYLPPQKYHIAARNFSAECARRPQAGVWVVLLHETDAQPEIRQALAGYRLERVIDGPEARAMMYVPADR